MQKYIKTIDHNHIQNRGKTTKLDHNFQYHYMFNKTYHNHLHHHDFTISIY